ncbi:hypothetical protein A3J17_05170 [Candidatus Curtissbacteria bacterium RIFCSPLOWO2_02_FULL_40_11]|uniref:Uncharacterized protein n=1 Tax=Candidatus Curtissbacteria bacterium RIFCSPLOWO2_12_FULL_38_9 TaxID=1797735 RepID=A0A1F5IAG8_9BACT|nr:MAG: hypothetical protein A3J17_05170 [Candidatus Curtissbacteria bacterium RIFCSPLOWO2_02_FULL_40_11]OGE13345.1 MAG: hypothetical protein A3G14_02650 [Candidatus Curtissbacteria bacterium RIFCSPLOWO2_12_FULL_38_9]
MNWRQVERKLRKINYTKGERSKERIIYNCPCPDKSHPVGVGLHPSQEAYPHDYKRKLGPHLDDF